MATQKRKPGVPASKCRVCGELFKKPQQLGAHMRYSHPRARKTRNGTGAAPAGTAPVAEVRRDLTLARHVRDYFPDGIPTVDEVQLLEDLRFIGTISTKLKGR